MQAACHAHRGQICSLLGQRVQDGVDGNAGLGIAHGKGVGPAGVNGVPESQRRDLFLQDWVMFRGAKGQCDVSDASETILKQHTTAAEWF